jgi:hypothetical protein
VIVSLAIKLLAPVSFTQILSIADQDSLVSALQSPSPAANLLACTILSKAAHSASDAAILSVMRDVVAEFLVRWLAAPQVEVGERGSKVLGDILEVDCELPPPPNAGPEMNGLDGTAVGGGVLVRRKAPGQGRMWRLIFRDRGLLSIITTHCTGTATTLDGSPLTPHQTTLAQGRLLRILPRLANLNFAAINQTEFPDLFAGVAGGAGRGPGSSEPAGLLQFAAIRMVDKTDVLMHLSLIDFFETLVSVMRVAEYSNYKMSTLRQLLRDATGGDQELKAAILSLPDRIVPEESELLRGYIREVMTGI